MRKYCFGQTQNESIALHDPLDLILDIMSSIKSPRVRTHKPEEDTPNALRTELDRSKAIERGQNNIFAKPLKFSL